MHFARATAIAASVVSACVPTMPPIAFEIPPVTSPPTAPVATDLSACETAPLTDHCQPCRTWDEAWNDARPNAEQLVTYGRCDELRYVAVGDGYSSTIEYFGVDGAMVAAERTTDVKGRCLDKAFGRVVSCTVVEQQGSGRAALIRRPPLVAGTLRPKLTRQDAAKLAASLTTKTVLVARIEIRPDGSVDASLVERSPFKHIDDLVLQHVKHWRFGKQIRAMKLDQPFTFEVPIMVLKE